MKYDEARYDARELAATEGMPSLNNTEAMSAWLDSLPTTARHQCVITCWDRRVGNAGVVGYVEAGYLEAHGVVLRLALTRMGQSEPVAQKLEALVAELLQVCARFPDGMPEGDEDYAQLEALDDRVWLIFDEFRCAQRRYFDAWA
ncbi:hypothetical protein [Deinococcus sp. SL84]|uniref:hypothetical protein n=1 Tax=Deinococcus sp. SL84 TaxID=2994663 RepID=UPI0022755980|nr:hypothetical protein [Deinococcus sp. SL84]MCY1703599.1 hypothetical protein [Deinococcus sp. SL84]